MKTMAEIVVAIEELTKVAYLIFGTLLFMLLFKNMGAKND